MSTDSTDSTHNTNRPMEPITVTLAGAEDPAEDLRRLELWLRMDEDLAPLLAHRERPAGETMGIGYDLMVQVLQETLQVTALTLLRCVYDHLHTRPADDLEVTVQVQDVRVVLTGRDTLTRGELEAMAARVRQAIEE
ncbi:hypothetical protein OG607_19825 [Streptomyces sp. NBC_01537]|uniref:effector-associated constant component EACC1 n=1 Tax=Streptomyces sp. NBC_01537 TaxID=2903896 RepID=UPI00386D1E8C